VSGSERRSLGVGLLQPEEHLPRVQLAALRGFVLLLILQCMRCINEAHRRGFCYARKAKNFSEVGRVGPTPRPVTGMGVRPGACSALAELVVFLFVASALASPAREVGRVFLVLNRSSGEWSTTTSRQRGCSLPDSEHPRFLTGWSTPTRRTRAATLSAALNIAVLSKLRYSCDET
jgi:hypothetical protein